MTSSLCMHLTRRESVYSMPHQCRLFQLGQEPSCRCQNSVKRREDGLYYYDFENGSCRFYAASIRQARRDLRNIAKYLLSP